MKSYKVLVLGDGGVGKTNFVRFWKGEEFDHKYIATIGVDVSKIELNTNHGNVSIAFWDMASSSKNYYLQDKYYENADAAIIMFDLTSRITYKNVVYWYKDIERILSSKIPIVFCGNKVDLQDLKVKEKQIIYPRKKQCPYFNISSKTCINIELPILYILKSLIDKDCFIIGKNDQIIDYDMNKEKEEEIDEIEEIDL